MKLNDAQAHEFRNLNDFMSRFVDKNAHGNAPFQPAERLKHTANLLRGDPAGAFSHDESDGVGAGQMSRVDSAMIATCKAHDRAKGSVCASDAFFPYPDGVEKVCQAGATAIVQPGGSKRDPDAVAMADQYNVAMVLTGMRHFRH